MVLRLNGPVGSCRRHYRVGGEERTDSGVNVPRASLRTVLGLALVLLVGCGLCACGAGSAGAGGQTDPGAPAPPLTPTELADGAAHACIVAGTVQPQVAWSRLDNPILSTPEAGVKDEALVWSGGQWHMLFSYVVDHPSSPGGVVWDVATATSPDLRHWSSIRPWPAQPGVLGVASPDVVRNPAGGFLVTYQSDPGSSQPPGTQARLFYRTSPNLVTWSPAHPLAPSLASAAGDRMIDAAFVFTGHQLLLGFKYSSPSQPDIFEMARSTSGQPQGPWRLVGRPDIEVVGGTIENYEFVMALGHWRLVATSNNLDQPWLFTLAGDPATATGWLQWTGGYQLDVPSQAFNSGSGLSSIDYEHANSAFLCNASALSGHFAYLLYAGSSELTQFGGWGHAAIGVARSTDLVHWQVPPG